LKLLKSNTLKVLKMLFSMQNLPFCFLNQCPKTLVLIIIIIVALFVNQFGT